MKFFLMSRPATARGFDVQLSIKAIPDAARDYTIPRARPLDPQHNYDDALLFLGLLCSAGRTCVAFSGRAVRLFNFRLNGELMPFLEPITSLSMLDVFKTARELIDGMLANNPREPFHLPGLVYDVTPNVANKRRAFQLR